MKKKADLIVINARVYSLDSLGTIHESFAVVNGRIASLGTVKEILGAYESPLTEDAMGKPVFPGFIDAHCHFYGYALGLRMVDLTGFSSFRELLGDLKRRADENPAGWIVGRGWDHNKWPGKQVPERSDLDRIFPTRPVVLIRVDGHMVLANGEALRQAGIGNDNRFQPGEVEVRNGILTGILRENAADRMRECIPEPEPDEKALLLVKAQENCFSAGLTGVCDAGLEYPKVRFIDSLQKEGRLKIHVNAMLTPEKGNLEHFVTKGIYETPGLTVRSVKIYADGSLGSRSALLKSPYADDPSVSGIQVTPTDSIRELCALAFENGYQVNTHAIGDKACKLILDMYGEFLKTRNDLRWRIEHAQVVDPEDLPLFRKYSVIPSVQATHATSDMYWASDRLGPDRIRYAYAYRQLLEQNGWLANGTDFPVEKIDPLLTFYAATARRDLSGYPTEGFQTENALSREEALRSITIWAARAGFDEGEMGSLEPGKAANFVILDRDILEAPVEEIPVTRVVKTFLRGEKVFSAEK